MPLPDGKVGWWRFEEAQDSVNDVPDDMIDYRGTNDATPSTGPVPRTVHGMVECAFDTVGGTAWATVPDVSYAPRQDEATLAMDAIPSP